ncbi:MAG TPA: hypothetical protein PKV41_05760 [Candidatus Omnitrophota bacterium]|nr:hypothetical protein [Candidatus Omnitrophota bacterium]
MPRQRIYLLVLAGYLTACFLPPVKAVWAGGLEKYLEGQPLAVGSVKFVPVSLRDGMESQKSPLWPLKNPSKIFEEPAFLENEKRALAVGIRLKDHLDQYSVSGYKQNTFFFLFYNFLTAVGCPNDYVVQRVRLTKLYYDLLGNVYKKHEQFLVEALALNLKKETKRADDHWKTYTLGKFFKRKVVIDLEIGCGEIPKTLTGKAWPHAQNPLYYRVQDYSDEPGLYDKVKYQFSSAYRITMEFDRDGKYSLELPQIK